jgi:hypothetical protein
MPPDFAITVERKSCDEAAVRFAYSRATDSTNLNELRFRHFFLFLRGRGTNPNPRHLFTLET